MLTSERFKLDVSPGFLLLLAGFWYLDREVGLLPWALLACVVHELGHIAAAVLLKGRVRGLSLSVVGAELRFEYAGVLSYGEENLLALAGPVANLLLGAVAYGMGAWLPAILSVGIGGFNLLPILPLDGGRVLYNVLSAHMEQPWPERVLTVLAGILAGILMGLGAIVAVEYANVTLVLTSGWLLIKILRNHGQKSK